MGTAPGFSCGGLQLCVQWPPGDLTCLWVVKSGVTFQICRTSRSQKRGSLASLMFEDDRGRHGQVNFKRRHVDGEVELTNDGGRTWLAFRLLHPPMPEKLGRVGNMSPNVAFGRCLVYRIDVSDLLEDKSERARLFQELFAFRLCTEPRPRQDHLLSPVRVHTYASGQPLNGWDNLPEYSRLPYSVKFLIECLTSSLKIDAFGVNEEAVSLLAMAGEERACLALRARLEDTPSQEILQWLEGYGPYNGAVYGVGEYGKEIGNVMVPRASVTPLRVVCQPPEQEMSNGVTRRFAEHSDRFLGVNFVDENMGRLQLSPLLAPSDCWSIGLACTPFGQRHQTFLKVHPALLVSCVVLSPPVRPRKSQLRGHACFFYAEGGEVDQISESGSEPAVFHWMGDMSGIDVVGKHAARLGQSLSSTTSTVEVPPALKKLVPDKKAGPYEFTDGCGMMSEGLAREVADVLGHSVSQPPPSAFQIRMGGCKGMLAVWPDSVMRSVSGRGGYKVLVRPSMQKFPSERNTLEVIQYARQLPCYLNRQFITLLGTLGVPDKVIEERYSAMVSTLDKVLRTMLSDPAEAEMALVRYYNITSGGKTGRKQVGPLWEALAMVRAGINIRTEPFLQSVLHATRDKAMIDLRHRTRIFVPDASCLLGIVDETGFLQPGQASDSLGCRSVNHYTANRASIMTNADRFGQCTPEPSKMSGGDLDGDLYSVVWDQDLLPPEREGVAGVQGDSENGFNFPAMGYEPPEKPKTSASSSGKGVDMKEIADFFLKYIQNDNLGKIANAHLVRADLSPLGARCDECLQLAALHSKAVDFPKSGVPAVFPDELKVDSYPDFMCKEDNMTYLSKKLIGRLFRDTPPAGAANPQRRQQQDERFLGGFELDQSLLAPGYEDFLEEAEVERFGGRMLKRTKLEDAQGRLNLEFLRMFMPMHARALDGRGSVWVLPRAYLREQIKAKFRAEFRGHNHDSDSDSDSDSNYDSEEGSEEFSEEHPADQGSKERPGEEEVDEGKEEARVEGKGSDYHPADAPDGVEVYQKASAWYFVSHSESTNPYMREAREEWRKKTRRGGGGGSGGHGAEAPLMLYLSFAWISAYEQLCQMRNMRL
ncbi:RNA-dependent RNA polymerase 1 [Ectocarpus siliculosus]|uniref:RNA-dependent RNA polymerase n=1 Tax=Ectocarpus siliculosus TaxID=2880 RepID=D8LC88_ECTSI|nr:RNA-dependent RNA polymerase 1 [Ectocarpus siliculosus]|eukprot:CBN78124.1 RNA-dependent RNA polymerase 1 [Ectocarpus siliculosus]